MTTAASTSFMAKLDHADEQRGRSTRTSARFRPWLVGRGDRAGAVLLAGRLGLGAGEVLPGEDAHRTGGGHPGGEEQRSPLPRPPVPPRVVSRSSTLGSGAGRGE